jgi:pimeloyl-ACP methyl ester carboxylesterase
MSFKIINPNKQLNFQINRVLTYGELACDEEEVTKKTAQITTLDEWETVWTAIGEGAEARGEYLRAAYAFRMAEFFLKKDNLHKEELYSKCIKHFYAGFDNLKLQYEKHNVPFENGTLNCIKLRAENAKGSIIVCGGYDSFIEEFVLQVSPFTERGYSVYLFEGPGQGDCLRQNMYFRCDFEKPAAAVLDFYKLDKCAMVGISWGGFFAMRCAAFEQRITAAVAYDVMDDGFEVMTGVFPPPLNLIFRLLFAVNGVRAVNFLIGKIRKRSIIADWAVSQGMYITGTDSPYEFYSSLREHSLKDISGQITQDVLLLAGERDHYIPRNQFHRLKRRLINTRSLTSRLFTKAEGGEQHCQIGNIPLAVNTILDWLDKRACR